MLLANLGHLRVLFQDGDNFINVYGNVKIV